MLRPRPRHAPRPPCAGPTATWPTTPPAPSVLRPPSCSTTCARCRAARTTSPSSTTTRGRPGIGFWWAVPTRTLPRCAWQRAWASIPSAWSPSGPKGTASSARWPRAGGSQPSLAAGAWERSTALTTSCTAWAAAGLPQARCTRKSPTWSGFPIWTWPSDRPSTRGDSWPGRTAAAGSSSFGWPATGSTTGAWSRPIMPCCTSWGSGWWVGCMTPKSGSSIPTRRTRTITRAGRATKTSPPIPIRRAASTRATPMATASSATSRPIPSGLPWSRASGSPGSRPGPARTTAPPMLTPPRSS